MDEKQQKPMVQGNWSCSSCDKEITELPFEPDGERPISCSDCWKEKRASGGQRQMVQGDWKCSDCGNEIKELPFSPAPDQQVSCRDCWRGKNS